MQRSSIIRTWNRNAADEEAMGAAHAPIWRRMIDVGVHEDLRQSTILDYGCNQGGFPFGAACAKRELATTNRLED